MSDKYEGGVKIMGSDGVLLTTGKVSLEVDPEHGNWTGLLETLNGTAVAGKALVVSLETPDRKLGDAQLVPSGHDGDRSISTVTGIGSAQPA